MNAHCLKMRRKKLKFRPSLAPCYITVAFVATLLCYPSLFAAANDTTAHVEVVTLDQPQIEQLKRTSPLLQKLISAASLSIGTPYKWGGSSLSQGIDCSNYTWQLFRKVGLPYKRYLGTQFMSRIHQNGSFQKIAFKEAQPGDLLVYGYKEKKQWHGHVVILIDKDGQQTGKKGLTLGAHGGEVNAVQYVTYAGFESGYFKHPSMKLVNVLRIQSPP